MSKLHTLLLSAAAITVSIAVAIPATAGEPAGQPLPAAVSLMAVGTPHPSATAHADGNTRIEERRRAEMAGWQSLLGSQQPFPAMGVGGHLR